MKKLFFKSMFAVLYVCGLYRAVHWLYREKITVLMLHGVMDERVAGEGFLPLRLASYISPGSLDRALSILSRYYSFVSMDDAVEMLSGNRPVKPNSLVVTMDDGYRNNIRQALPIFKRYNIKPCLYVATNHIEKQEPFWFDRLDYVLQFVSDDHFDIELGNEVVRINRTSRSALVESYSKFRRVCMYVFDDDLDMNNRLNEIASELEFKTGRKLVDVLDDNDWFAVSNWDELREVSSRQEMDIGSHTLDHIRLGHVSSGVVEQQLRLSSKKISEEVGQCRHFCYPNGDYTHEASEQVVLQGYRSATTTETGLNSVGGDLVKLKRIAFPDRRRAMDVLYALSPMRME